MKKRKIFFAIILFAIILTLLIFLSYLKTPAIILATTTSIENSGLLDVLLPEFEKIANCKVKVIACGSGQAIKLATDGNADVIFVHDPEAEEEFIKSNPKAKRYTIMYNNFVVVGPKSNPAKISKGGDIKSVSDIFKKIIDTNSYFVSRADNSGTHKKELSIWKKINSQKVINYKKSKLYLESGTSMAQTLYIANEKSAYCLTDNATFVFYKNKLPHLEIIFDDPIELFNPYSVIRVSEKELSIKFVEFITSSNTKEIIKNYGIKQFGQPLFHPL